MKALFVTGLLVLIFGLVSLFVAFPKKERHEMNAGGISMGIETQHNEKLPTVVSAVLIVAGAGMMVGSRGRS
jgi:uncharacterized membrane protein